MLERLGAARLARERAPAPSRAEVNPAARELVDRYGPSILQTARRYAQTAEDAEDAYQRGLEILLTKAPTTNEDELLPWLKTVIKHEAFALRRQRERNGGLVGDEALEATPATLTTDEQAELRERLRVGAEAMGRLKPQEVRCLVLLAEGFSYQEICSETGWTYTKVNRCLTEGRRAFTGRVREIEEGGECERLAPALSALADGEVSAEQAKLLRRHLRGCPACRVTLGEFRTTPGRVAALVPPVLVATDGDLGSGAARGLSTIGDWFHERLATLGLKVQGFTEMASAQKVAAVTASTAAIAGGGVGVVATMDELRESNERPAERHIMGPRPPAASAAALPSRVVRRFPARKAVLHEVRREHAESRRARAVRASRAQRASAPAPAVAQRSSNPAPRTSSEEFGIERSSGSTQSSTAGGTGGEFSSAPRTGSGSGASGGSEFTFESSSPAPSSPTGGGEFSP